MSKRFAPACSSLLGLALCHLALGQPGSGNTLTSFSAPNAYQTYAVSINDAGAIGGNYIDTSSLVHGFERSPSGVFATFDAPGAGTGLGQGTWPTSINSAGEITGDYFDAGSIGHGFVRSPSGAFTTFDAPGIGLDATIPTSINAQGAITGYYYGGSAGAFVRSASGAMVTFNAPGAVGGTQAASINNSGVIAGWFADSTGVNHGFVRSASGELTAFDAPGAGTSYPYGTQAQSINAAGAITGFYVDAGAVYHGFVRSPYGVVTTFDAPHAGTSAHLGTLAWGINQAGAVAGYVLGSKANWGFERGPSGDIQEFAGPGAAFDGSTFAFSINRSITGYYYAGSDFYLGFVLTP
ncbi:MAG: hypothetical protein ABSH50_18575 [Bryobacteraceae bacterium]|jgi:hypothetical protein